jgi:hypothetical protein
MFMLRNSSSDVSFVLKKTPMQVTMVSISLIILTQQDIEDVTYILNLGLSRKSVRIDREKVTLLYFGLAGEFPLSFTCSLRVNQGSMKR